jgi:hypothetical protein
VCILGTQRYGFDKHVWDVPRAQYGSAALVWWQQQQGDGLTDKYRFNGLVKALLS